MLPTTQPPLSPTIGSQLQLNGDREDQKTAASAQADGSPAAAPSSFSRALTLPPPTSTSLLPVSPSPTELTIAEGGNLETTVRALAQLQAHTTVRQHHINQVNGQLHALSFFLNYFNAKDTQVLQSDYRQVKEDIREGKQLVHAIQSHLTTQERALATVGQRCDDLSEDLEETKERHRFLETTVGEHKREIDGVLEDYNQKLIEQGTMIQEQEKQLSKLLATRFRVDFGVDLVILLVSYWVSHSRTLSAILNIIFSSAARVRYTSTDMRLRSTKTTLNLFIKAAKMAVCAALVVQFRAMAVRSGLHNFVGSYSSYAAMLTNSAQALTTGAVGNKEDSDMPLPLRVWSTAIHWGENFVHSLRNGHSMEHSNSLNAPAGIDDNATHEGTVETVQAASTSSGAQ